MSEQEQRPTGFLVAANTSALTWEEAEMLRNELEERSGHRFRLVVAS